MSTEGVNQRSRNIDSKTTLEMLEIINAEDKTVADAVEKALPQIAAVIDAAVKGLKKGGRIIYVGAGTSGRLAIQDAAECTVTYGVPEGTVSAIMAGGHKAVFSPSENIEDIFEQGMADVNSKNITENDCVIGISASGNANYVCGALKAAKDAGAITASLICNEKGRIQDYSDYSISVVTGAEVISGSTRMKAGTAQKMVLNMISTASMIHLGKVTDNFMTWMTPTNEKLQKRACFIISQVCNISEQEAEILLKNNENKIQKAIKDFKERK